jgi:hypothetical protein
MAKVEELLGLAADCYAQARISSNPLIKAELTVMGDDYLKQADELQRSAPIVHATFPRPGNKIGQNAGAN